MRGLFGVTNSGIFQIQDLLLGYKKAKGEKLKVQILGFEDKPDKKADIVIVPTVNLFAKHLKEFNESKAIVYVVDSPVLCEYLKPIILLDVAEKKLSYVYKFAAITQGHFNHVLEEALSSKDKIKVKYKQLDMIPTMLGHQLSTVLSPIQKYLYKIRDLDKRLVHQKAIFSWLISKGNSSQLKKHLLAVNKTPNAALEELLAFFSTDLGVRSQSAFREAAEGKAIKNDKGKGKAVNVKALAKKHNIDPYDIRYTLKVIRRFGTWSQVNKTANELYNSNEKAKAHHAAKNEAKK